MLQKFLAESITLIVGKQFENLVDILYSKGYVNEFIIAKKLDITINQARNILYKVSDHGLLSSIRKKDKKKGWFTYFWQIEVLKTLEFLKNNYLNKADQLRHQIKSRETKQFYFCERCHIEFNEENALLHNFTCPECGNILALKDNAPVLKDLRKNLFKFEKELALIEKEIEIEKQKEIKTLKSLKKIKPVKKAVKVKTKKSLKKTLPSSKKTFPSLKKSTKKTVVKKIKRVKKSYSGSVKKNKIKKASKKIKKNLKIKIKKR